MFSPLLCFAAVLAAANAAGELAVVYSPESIKFHGSEPFDGNLLKEIYSSALSFTTSESSNWNGMRITDPFHMAEAIVCVVVEGVASLGEANGYQNRFPINSNVDEKKTWKTLKHRVLARFPEFNNTLVRIELDDESTFSNYVFGTFETTLPSRSYNALDSNVTEDHQFLHQIDILNQITLKVKSGAISRDSVPDVYWFVLSGLHHLVDFHGQDSPVTEEAKAILSEAVVDLSEAFSSAYDGHVLVSVVASDVAHTRRSRSLMQDASKKIIDVKDINLAEDYSEDYPVIFNILLWFTVAFCFSLFAISVGIANLDPGRDSIIYRMTSNRMKKDN